MDEKQQLEQSLQYIKDKIDIQPKLAIILGSGLGSLADTLKNSTVISTAKIPHYPISTVPDHAGIWVIGYVSNVPILALKGRVHTYEGYSAREVTYSIRLMAKLGIEKLIVTNAAGGANPNFAPGDLMVITDHINFLFDNPLIGDNQVSADQRFVDMYNAYDKNFIQNTITLGKSLDIPLQSGVLFSSKGPTYETAAEVRMAHAIGADALTMSTVPEVIAARQQNIRVLGISCITNLATGISEEKLNHEEVQETANRIKDTFIRLVKEVIVRIPEW
ncbi:purine-nucleoside phosphorylase [candidate division KSB1 bacterium 4484_87]|nr:MAG: purine-nucleoside phosphorylase [candidate division KSB1 bacterium 4484_87]